MEKCDFFYGMVTKSNKNDGTTGEEEKDGRMMGNLYIVHNSLFPFIHSFLLLLSEISPNQFALSGFDLLEKKFFYRNYLILHHGCFAVAERAWRSVHEKID